MKVHLVNFGARLAVVDAAAVLALVGLGEAVDDERLGLAVHVEARAATQVVGDHVLRLGQRVAVARIDCVDRHRGVESIPQHQCDVIL